MSEKWHELLLNYMEQELERAQDSKNIDKRVSEDYFKFCDLIRKAITISNTIHYKSEDHPELILNIMKIINICLALMKRIKKYKFMKEQILKKTLLL